MPITSHQIASNLFLVRQGGSATTKAPAKPVELPTNHVAVIDCSGSMYNDLPKIREQLKKKLPKLLGEKDTISIIWFSGRTQCGTLLEAEPVATLTDLQQVNQAIDRWLKPMCLTGFKEPLEEASALVDRVAKKTKGSIFSLFFMSDGCDNQWGRGEILKAVESVGVKVASTTIVEYGYYADRPLLAAMAEKAGGCLIFAETFDKYEPLFEGALQKKLSGAPRVEVKIPGDAIGGFAFAMDNGDLLTFGIENGSVQVPEDLPEVWYLSPSVTGKKSQDIESISDPGCEVEKGAPQALSAAYAAVSLYAQRMKADVVLALLKATGDVKYIEQFSSCFGKQKYSDFMDAAKTAAFTPKERLVSGFDPNKVPRDDAFTVLELLQILSEDEDNKVLLEHPDFKYSKIGRGTVDTSEVLTADEVKQVAELSTKIASEKNAAKLKELTEQLSAITAKKGPALKFVADPAPDGYSISSLTFNEDRPNVSFLVRKTGKVDLDARLPDNLKGKVPAAFSTYIFRNYAVVKDGLVNIEKLPVRVTKDTARKLSERDALTGSGLVGAPGKFESGVLVFDLRALPVINRKMVKACSAKLLFEKEYELCQARAAQKVYNTVKKEKFPRKSEGFEVTYGAEATTWLKEQGLTDYGGFAPKTVQAEAKDFYMGKELKTSIKGFSSLPSLKEAREKIAKGKPNGPTLLMADAIKAVDAHEKDKAFEKWLDEQLDESRKAVRGLLFDLAQVKFSIVVGQIWFTEFASLDENSLDVTLGGAKIPCKVEQKEIKVEI
jgi:hypothetical protein